MSRNLSAASHGPGDSLDLLGEQDRVLAAIFSAWDDSDPDRADTNREVVKLAYDHGTLGKLLIEHAAIRVAAKRDIERVLRDIDCDDLADQLTSQLTRVCELLDRLDEHARGVVAVGVSRSLEFAGAVGELAATIRADLSREPEAIIPRIEAALADQRSRLRSAKHVAAHAPTHPNPTPRWYDTIPILVRIHARYDHLRGYPWADSTPYSNPRVAERYDTQP